MENDQSFRSIFFRIHRILSFGEVGSQELFEGQVSLVVAGFEEELEDFVEPDAAADVGVPTNRC